MPSFILTRLHARYSKEALGQDLVFKVAPPISGGREVRGPDGSLEHGATPAAIDNFQGRYAIRHAWTGPVTCKEPRRGIWGGPPPGQAGDTSPKPATKTAFVARDKVKVEQIVMKDIPELGVKASGAAIVAGVKPPQATKSTTPSDKGASSDAPEAPARKGCTGCTSTSRSRSDETLAGALTALLVLALHGRRRARGRNDRRAR
jgi:hypothetical protein